MQLELANNERLTLADKAYHSLAFSFNNTFGAPTVSNSAFNTSAGVFTNTFSLTGESGRYVQMSFLNDGRWAFLSEISFDGNLILPPPPVPAPEPSSLMLLGLGGMGLTILRRQRRKTGHCPTAACSFRRPVQPARTRGMPLIPCQRFDRSSRSKYLTTSSRCSLPNTETRIS